MATGINDTDSDAMHSDDGDEELLMDRAALLSTSSIPIASSLNEQESTSNTTVHNSKAMHQRNSVSSLT